MGRIRAIGAGTIVIIVEASNEKKFALQLFAYHVPQIAINLISVYYLCKRGYVVEHNLPNTTISTYEGKGGDIFFQCPRRGRLWTLPFRLKTKPQEEYVFASTAMHPAVCELHEKYGHASLQKLKRMTIVGELDGFTCGNSAA